MSVGKIGTLEVDFVASNAGKKIYCQVAASVADNATLERELRPLRAVDDNYEKYIISMDRMYTQDFDGIKLLNLPEFLLGQFRETRV